MEQCQSASNLQTVEVEQRGLVEKAFGVMLQVCEAGCQPALA